MVRYDINRSVIIITILPFLLPTLPIIAIESITSTMSILPYFFCMVVSWSALLSFDLFVDLVVVGLDIVYFLFDFFKFALIVVQLVFVFGFGLDIVLLHLLDVLNVVLLLL